jgi:hypothetical protein
MLNLESHVNGTIARATLGALCAFARGISLNKIIARATVGAGLFFGTFVGWLAAEEMPAAAPPSPRDQYHLPIASWARPTNTPAYWGYYVGGGAAIGGEPRYLTEGVWGWDYEGSWFRRQVWLAWYHGQRYQGGTGSYDTGRR